MTTYIVEMVDGHKFRPEETECIKYFNQHQISWIPMTLRQMRRRDIFKLKDLYIPIGSIPFMYAAMTKLGVPRPKTNDYPTCFSARDYGRAIPRIRVFGDIEDDEFPLFIKPAESLKRFTGLVMQDKYNYIASQINPKHKVWTSEVIDITGETRIYVVDGKYVGKGDYEGEVKTLQIGFINSCIQRLAKQGHLNYVLDIGINKKYENFVIEFNDGFSIGLYNKDLISDYIRLLTNRWLEIIGCKLNITTSSVY